MYRYLEGEVKEFFRMELGSMAAKCNLLVSKFKGPTLFNTEILHQKKKATNPFKCIRPSFTIAGFILSESLYLFEICGQCYYKSDLAI